MVAGLRALLDGIIDYAGLFPPARLPLEQAVRNYLRYRRDPESWMLARFVCPATRLAELSALLNEIGQGEAPVPLAVLGRGGDTPRELGEGLVEDLKAILALRQRFSGRATVEAFELRGLEKLGLPARPEAISGLDDSLSQAVGPLTTFWEIPFTAEHWATRQAVLLGMGRRLPERDRVGLKFRCGGVHPESFPTPGDVASVITACRDAGVPLKFTAGLHQPIRHFDHTLRVRMHGFVNVFGAAVLAHARGVTEEQLRPILEDEDAGDFVFDEAGFRWKDYRAGTEEIVAARRRVVSFGSCSFDEPRDDLRALGWLI
jgi:hypothetical protein